MHSIDRRQLAIGGAAMLALGAMPGAHAQAKPKLRFSAAFSETDLRAEGYKALAAAMKDDFDFEPYWSNTSVQAGHRARRPSARESRAVQSGSCRHLQADTGLVAADLGLSLPRLRAPQEDLRQRHRLRNSSRWRAISWVSR